MLIDTMPNMDKEPQDDYDCLIEMLNEAIAIVEFYKERKIRACRLREIHAIIRAGFPKRFRAEGTMGVTLFQEQASYHPRAGMWQRRIYHWPGKDFP